MSQKKCKLVLKSISPFDPGDPKPFEIVKSVNTLEFGVPGDELYRKTVDRILIDHAMRIRSGKLTVEFIN